MNDMYDFRAPAMSWAQVDAAADSVRESFRLVDVPYFRSSSAYISFPTPIPLKTLLRRLFGIRVSS